jgi:hypothetical protein
MKRYTLGQRVRILRTGDPDIDKYRGQTGIVIRLTTFIIVQMPDSTELTLNEWEIEAA